MIVDFLSQTMEAKWTRHNIFQVVKEKKFQPSILYPDKQQQQQKNLNKENSSPADLSWLKEVL